MTKVKQVEFDFYTVAEVAKLLKVDAVTIRRYIRAGKIKAVKVSERRYMIPVDEISYLFSEELG